MQAAGHGPGPASGVPAAFPVVSKQLLALMACGSSLGIAVVDSLVYCILGCNGGLLVLGHTWTLKH